MTDTQAAEIVSALGVTGDRAAAAAQVKALYRTFAECDCTMVEVNPLAETRAGELVAADAKLGFDDAASFRQKDIFAMRDASQEDPREVAAAKFDLNYIGLDGSIGCMVNGAGLAMATMDIIKLHGGAPANFLDVGGNASEAQVCGGGGLGLGLGWGGGAGRAREASTTRPRLSSLLQVVEAFKILTADPRVKALLVNIFGGIMKCDVIAAGIVNAAKQVGVRVPLIVRLEGTNVDEGKRILAGSDVDIISADDLDDAAVKAVKAIQ